MTFVSVHVVFFSDEFLFFSFLFFSFVLFLENMRLLHLSRTAIYILCRPYVGLPLFCTLEEKTKEI